MINLRPIIDEFTISELDMPEQFKEAVRPCVEYLLDSKASFSTVVQLASLMLRSYAGDLKVTDSFANAHPENRIETYSSPDMFLTFYLLMLAAKAENLSLARAEMKEGRCSHFSIACAGDHESCSMCKEKGEMPLSACSFATVPPFHVGCRCGMIFKVE